MMKPVRDPANSSGHWAQAQVVYAEETMRVILHLSAFSMVPGAAVAAMTEPIPEPGHRALRLEQRHTVPRVDAENEEFHRDLIAARRRQLTAKDPA